MLWTSSTSPYLPSSIKPPAPLLLPCRSEFEGLLEKGPSEANAYLEDPEK